MTTPSPNPFTPEDLTSFALGELDPAGDTHRAIAAALAQDPALRAEIDAINASAATVRDALANEPVTTAQGGAGVWPALALTDSQAGPAATSSKKTSGGRTPLFARPALLAAGFALAAGAAVVVVTLVQQDPAPHIAEQAPTVRGLGAIQAALDTPVTASFKEAPLEQVFAKVAETTHTELAIDWDALEARGISRDTTLTFDAEAVPARDLMTLTLSAAWQQLPHPDPVVWTVTATEVRVEPRSVTVQRSLDQAQRVLASMNTTSAQMTQNQLALAADPGWQQPGEWTEAYWAWQAEAYETANDRQIGESDDEFYNSPDGEILSRDRAERESRIRTADPAAAPSLNLAPPAPGRRSTAGQPGQQQSGLQAQTRGRSRAPEAFYAEGDVSRYAVDGLASGEYRSVDGRIQGQQSFGYTSRGLSLASGDFTLEPAEANDNFDKTETIVAGVVVERLAEEGEERGDTVHRGQRFDHLGQHRHDPVQLTRDTYALVNDNPFRTGLNDPLSTFSVDVDTAAYSIVRRQLVQQGRAPVPEAVRIEELINYFGYDYSAPKIEPGLLDHGVVTQRSLERLAADDDTFAPFATHVEVADCPWADGHQLVRIGVKGMEVEQEDRPSAHLTFLLDVSGSMNRENKLPLVKEALTMLLGQLNADDHVSIVVYAGAAGLVLEHASAADVRTIEETFDKLRAGGSTAGGAGIELAYDVAQRHYVAGGVNRVILCTDGDFNVGVSDRDQLVELIKNRANPEPDDSGATRGVYLSVMGFGFGNLNDNMMEPLTNAGNGNYAYIDTADEAHKVMVEQVGGTLVTIAKDVKIQVEFNPSQVLAYRLIGYENRILAAEDFADDTVDAGDIGAGHTVTALYEVVPFPDDGLGDEESLRMVKEQIEALDEALAFSTSVLENTPLTEEQYQKLVGSVRMMQQQRQVALAIESRAKGLPPAVLDGGIEMRYRSGDAFIDGLDELNELMVVNLRYKPVDAPAEQGTSRLIQTVVPPSALPFNDASEDTRFAAAVAGFGMVLRHSPHRGEADMQWVLDTANASLGVDAFGYRAGFVSLVEQADQLVPERDAEKERNLIAPRGHHEPMRGRE